MRILAKSFSRPLSKALSQRVFLSRAGAFPALKGHRLPVIIAGIGGINSCGRSGGQNTFFRNIILDALETAEKKRAMIETLRLRECIRFDGQSQKWCTKAGAQLSEDQVIEHFAPTYDQSLSIRRLPFGANVEAQNFELIFDAIDRQHLSVSYAGQLPEGINLDCASFGAKGRTLPRTLRMALMAGHDALGSSGLSYLELMDLKGMHMGRSGVYFGSAMGQVGSNGIEGYIRRYMGLRSGDPQAASNKGAAFHMPASLVNMSSAFLSHYLLGHVGHVSSDVGACATFTYNLYNAVQEIRSGTRLLALVGAADSVLTPSVLTSYATMKALATDVRLKSAGLLDASGDADPRRSFNAFGEPRLGFDIGESAQMVVLMHPLLAAMAGVLPLGMIGDVRVSSDGFKESISKVGVGDHFVLARLVKSLAEDLGIDSLRRHSFVTAHGTSTPDNGTSESFLLSNMADMAGIESWPVTAVKGDVAHGLGAAGGDQLASVLGIFGHGIIPRIRNLRQTGVADDIHQKGLRFLDQHRVFGIGEFHAAIALQKGFGGCNAGFTVYAPEIARQFIERFMKADIDSHAIDVREQRQHDFEEGFLRRHADLIRYIQTHPGETRPTDFSDLEFIRDPKTGIPTAIKIRGMGNAIDL